MADDIVSSSQYQNTYGVDSPNWLLSAKDDHTTIHNKWNNSIVYNTTNCGEVPMPYFMFPRSSISKIPLRLANNVGIIDSGYRGELMAVVDNISDKDYIVEQGQRLFQLCTGDLTPFYNVKLVDELDQTTRGEGGFGSTGM